MATRTFAPQNISLIVVDEDAVDVAAPGQLKIDLRPSVSGAAKTDLSNVAAQTLTLGDGTSSPALTLNKSDGGTGKLSIKVGSTERARLGLTTGEALELVQNDGSGSEVGKLSFNATTGALTSTKGLTISSGGLTVTAGGVTVTAGGLTISAGAVRLGLTQYADNAAALAGGLVAGDTYILAATKAVTVVV